MFNNVNVSKTSRPSYLQPQRSTSASVSDLYLSNRETNNSLTILAQHTYFQNALRSSLSGVAYTDRLRGISVEGEGDMVVRECTCHLTEWYRKYCYEGMSSRDLWRMRITPRFRDPRTAL